MQRPAGAPRAATLTKCSSPPRLLLPPCSCWRCKASARALRRCSPSAARLPGAQLSASRMSSISLWPSQGRALPCKVPVRGAAKCPCYLRASSPVGQREFALAPQSHLFRLCSHSPSSFPRHEVPHSICAPRRPAEASSIPPGPLFPVFRTAPGPPSGRKGGEGSFFGNSEPTSGHLPPRDGAQPRRPRRAPQGLVAQRPRF